MNISAAIVRAATAWLCLSAAARAEDACTFEEIEPLDGYGVRAFDLNNWGTVVGTLFGSPGAAFTWRRGQTKKLPSPPEARDAGALAVNDWGQVVGYAALPEGTVPVLWTSQGVVRLSGRGYASDINNRGQIVGYEPGAACLFWNDARSEPTRFEGLGGGSCRFEAIDDSGQAVGVANDAAGVSHAFVWRLGEVTDLAEVDAPMAESGAATILLDVNQRGLAVGYAQVEDGDAPFLWSERGGGRALPLRGRAAALNDWGTVALFEVLPDDSILSLSDRHGYVRTKGSLGGQVLDLALNERFQITWMAYREAESIKSYFCQLR